MERESEPSNYEHEYNTLAEDVLHSSDEGSDDDFSLWGGEDQKKKGKKGPRRGEEEEEVKENPFMLFDFRFYFNHLFVLTNKFCKSG